MHLPKFLCVALLGLLQACPSLGVSQPDILSIKENLVFAVETVQDSAAVLPVDDPVREKVDSLAQAAKVLAGFITTDNTHTSLVVAEQVMNRADDILYDPDASSEIKAAAVLVKTAVRLYLANRTSGSSPAE